MEIFIEISIVLIITTGIATIMRFLRQPLIIGYLLSGVIVGPYLLNVLQSNNEVELFSKVGIAMLLFIVGLSLNPDTIKETGKPALITGIGQILFTSAIGFGIMKVLGFSNTVSMYGAIALTFSSTIIILKLLSDRGDLNSLYGKISIGFLLVQDIVATLLLIIVPLVGSYNTFGGNLGIEFFKLFLSGFGVSIILYAFAKYILPTFSDYLAKSSELLFIFSVSWGLVLATLFYKIGFSIEIGALIAGVTLSASKYSFEISSRMRPLRDFFIVMFFVLLGSHLIFTNIGTLILPAIILSAFVLIGNPLIVFVLMNRLKYTHKVSFMAGLTVAQISEFSLILMALGLSLGHVDQTAVTLITLVGIITITGSTYFMMHADTLYQILHRLKQFFTRQNNGATLPIPTNTDVEMIVFGFGRVGFEFITEAKKKDMNYLAVDYNPAVFNTNIHQDLQFRFGDAEDVEFLDDISMNSARIIISTIPDIATNILLARYYRTLNKDGVVLVTCHSIEDAERLYAEGVTYVILPHYLGAYHATQMIRDFESDAEIFTQARKIQEQQFIRHRTLFNL